MMALSASASPLSGLSPAGYLFISRKNAISDAISSRFRLPGLSIGISAIAASISDSGLAPNARENSAPENFDGWWQLSHTCA